MKKKYFLSAFILTLHLLFFCGVAFCIQTEKKTSLEIISYMSARPAELSGLLDIAELYKFPELNLVLQQFQNNSENPDSGFFGIDFANNVKAYLFFYDNSRYPELLIKLRLADFDLFNAVIQYFSAQTYQIEQYSETDNEKYLIKKIDSDEDKHKIPAALYGHDLYILVDFLSFSKIKIDKEKIDIESDTKPMRLKNAFSILDKLKTCEFEKDFFPADIEKAKEKAFIYAFNKSAIPYLEKVIGMNIASRLKIDTDSLTNNFITFSTGSDFLEILNFEFKKKLEINTSPRLNINALGNYLIGEKILGYANMTVNNTNIVEYLKRNDFISLPGVKHYLLTAVAQLTGDISGYIIKNNDKINFSDDEEITFSKLLLNNYSPVLLLKCSDLKDVSSSLKQLSELYPDNFSIKYLKNDSMYIVSKNENNNLPVDFYFCYLSEKNEKYFVTSSNKMELQRIINNFRDVNELMKKSENNIFNYFLKNKFNIMDIDNGFCYFNISAFFNEIKIMHELNPLQRKLAGYLAEKLECWFTYTTYFNGYNKNRHIIKAKKKFSFGELYGILKNQGQ